MLRHKPKLTYNGLTIVMSNPSRFDARNLLSASGGRIVDEALKPHFNRYQCDIRVREDKSPLIHGTKCILLLGELAVKDWIGMLDAPLGAIRGSPYFLNNSVLSQGCEIPVIASFFPQDAADIQDYEKEFNEKSGQSLESDSNQEASDSDEKSRHGRTARRNYRFWLTKDIEKCKRILAYDGKIPPRPFEPKYIIYPKSEEVLDILNNTKGKNFFMDVETFPFDFSFKCLAFSFGYTEPIYSVPFFTPDLCWAYSNLHLIFRGLAIALRDNCAIAHNGSGFDFFWLAQKYRIPIGRNVYDTMLAQHRCFSDVEKSLGHCISLWTWEQFHKDEGNVGYYNSRDMIQTLEYCAKDVYTMKLVHHAIEIYANKIPGLKESIQEANAAIRPYLITSLQGLKYDDSIRQNTITNNDRLMMQYLRILKILVGEDNLAKIAGKSKASMPSSNKQCIEYFHNMLGYSVVARGITKEDGTKGASLGKKAMYKLRLKYNNPAIDVILAYRELQKETSSLKFANWKEDTKNETTTT